MFETWMKKKEKMQKRYSLNENIRMHSDPPATASASLPRSRTPRAWIRRQPRLTGGSAKSDSK